MDYRILSIIALLSWGAWGFMAKLLSRHMSSPVLILWTTVGSLAPTLAFVISRHGLRWERGGELALAAGALASVATIAFYLALKNGPASVVVPFSGLYILIPALLGFIFLREPLSASHVLGTACAGAAIFLLSR